ncbi:MAG: hypothetical protein U0527_13635 [Candidatus Eisenbacteria bacterium]
MRDPALRAWIDPAGVRAVFPPRAPILARLLPIVLAALCLMASGCTVIGFGVGSFLDHVEGRERSATAERLRSARGRRVVLELRDRTTVRGTLVRFECAAETTCVVRPRLSRREREAERHRPDSVRVAVHDIESIATPTHVGRIAITGVGIGVDTYYLILMIGLAAMADGS